MAVPCVLYSAKSSPDEKGSTADQLAQIRRALPDDRQEIAAFSEENSRRSTEVVDRSLRLLWRRLSRQQEAATRNCGFSTPPDWRAVRASGSKDARC
jgi:hypothetical protein